MYLSSTGQTFCTASVKLSGVEREDERRVERGERRTTFVKHVAKSSTAKDDISLDDERKAVSTRHSNPIVLTLSGRHEERVSDVIHRNQWVSGNGREVHLGC